MYIHVFIICVHVYMYMTEGLILGVLARSPAFGLVWVYPFGST